MKIRILIVSVFLFSIYSTSQVNDRQRQKSEVFNKRRELAFKMSQMLWNYGSVSFSPILSLGQVGYDSNLFSQPQDQAISDFGVAPSLGINSYFRINPKWIANVNATGQYVWYKDNPGLRGWNPKYEAHIYGLLKRLFLEAAATYSRDLSRINSETLLRSENEKRQYHLEAKYQLTPKATISAQFTNYKLDYLVNEDKQLQYNRNQDMAGLIFYYMYSKNFWPYLEYENHKVEFSGGSRPYQVEGDTFYIGTRNEQGNRFHYLAKIGVSQDQYDFPPDQEIQGFNSDDPVYQLYVQYHLSRKFFIEFGSNQNLIYSYLNDYSHYLSQRLLVGFGYTFQNGIEVGPDFYFGGNHYQALEASGNQDETYDYKSTNLNLKFPLAEKVKMKFAVGYENRDIPNFSESISGWYSFFDVNYYF